MTSPSDYQTNCAKIISGAIEKPGLYYRELREFEYLLLGYFEAYSEIFSECQLPNSFSWDFSNWLWKTKRISTSSGWGMAIEELAKKEKMHSNELFSDLVKEFLPFWLDSPGGEIQ